MIHKFEVGKIYKVHTPGNSDHIHIFEIVKRTDKTVIVNGFRCFNKRLRIKIYGDSEIIKPFGTYSMCLVVWAKDGEVKNDNQ